MRMFGVGLASREILVEHVNFQQMPVPLLLRGRLALDA
jgi:hypothetical protein